MKTKKLVTTAMLMALSAILSLIVVFALPFGGSITAASMMPIILVGYLYGINWGLLSSFVYSLIQLLLGAGTVSAFFLPSDSQMTLYAALLICLLDYICAFTVLGLSGIFKGKLKNSVCELILGAVFVCVLRYGIHILSGAVFFGSWADWFFSDTTGLSQIKFMEGFCNWTMANFSGMGLSVFYSVVYNGAYMIPETVITAFTAPIVYKVSNR